jgi:hypothetical protein
LAYSAVIFLILIFAYTYLQIDIDISFEFISIIYSLVAFIILGSWIINLLKNYKLFNWINNIVKHILSKNIIFGCFIVIFLLFAGVLEKEILKRSIEMQIVNDEYLAISLLSGLMIAFSSTFLLRLLIMTINDYNRKVCCIRDRDNKKYYIYYAADKNFVVCGTEAILENCKVFRFISILEIKKNFEVHIEKISLE